MRLSSSSSAVRTRLASSSTRRLGLRLFVRWGGLSRCSAARCFLYLLGGCRAPLGVGLAPGRCMATDSFLNVVFVILVPRAAAF